MRNPYDEKAVRLELDRCVKCGMCLPECPTYRLETNENESPRGRLALIEGLLSGRLTGDGPLIRHLDNCLTCRRCERVCPSQVRYGYLIDAARAQLPPRNRLLASLVRRPVLMKIGVPLARSVPRALSRPFGPLSRIHRIAGSLPLSGSAPHAGDYPALAATERGRIGMFVGCIGAALQGGALSAALHLLRRAGYAVSIPAAAGCCGALSRHSGDAATAETLAARNRDAFDPALDAVVSIASGCGIHLDAYDPPLPVRHLDINRFLHLHGGFTRDDFLPLPRPVALHTPCSVENVYRGTSWARALLSLIPGLRIHAVGEAGQCCGAAGDYMLRRPAQADRLRAPILQQFLENGHTLLVTSNIGCAMHLAAGLRDKVHGLEVMHPVELLARQLRQSQ